MDMLPALEFEKDKIWLIEYPIRYFGMGLNARMTIIALNEGGLFVHSPGPLTEATREFVAGLGTVSVIVAPGNFHHLYFRDWVDFYPQAEAFICPGLERKIRALKTFSIIEERGGYPWSDEMDHLSTQGSWIVNEVVFFHRTTRTLLVVDLIENFTGRSEFTPMVKFWLKHIFRMWDNPKPAPEYRLGWRNRKKARVVFENILRWDFQKIILAHGDLIDREGGEAARKAWASVLK